jgi:hypothetical protein
MHSTGAAMRHRCASISDAYSLCKYIASISQRSEKAEFNPRAREEGRRMKEAWGVYERVVDRSNKHAQIRAREVMQQCGFCNEESNMRKVRYTAMCVRLMARYSRCDSYKRDFDERIMRGLIFSECVFMFTNLFSTDM